MGVSPGSPVSASNSNQAWLDANGDDTGVGIYDLQNTVAASGPFVSNIQREINSLDSFTGRSAGSVYNAKPSWTNNNAGLSTDDLKTRTDNIDAKFNTSTGHTHNPSIVGDGPAISATNLINVNLIAYVQQGTDLIGVTGGSTNVTTELTGKTPSTAPTNIGVVVNAPYNKIIITQATGVNEGDHFTDGSGNVVYGRLTESSGTWTLTYYVLISGTETPYSFSSSSDLRWYYQEIFNPLDGVNTPPVYNSLFFTPSDNATADVVDATPSVRGLVNTTTQSFGGNKTFTGNVDINGTTTLNTGLSGPLRASSGVVSTGNTDLTSEVTGVLPIANGGTNGNTQTTGFNNLSPLTTKGDLVVHNGTNNIRLPIGSDGQTLVADSTQSSGVKWGVGISYRAGNQALSISDSSKVITFSSAMPSTNYRVSVNFVNTTDTNPAFQPITVTAKTTTQITLKWNSGVPSANYSIDYIVVGDL